VHRIARRGNRVRGGRVLALRVVRDGCPGAHVLGISAEFLESEGPIRPAKDIHAAVCVRCRRTRDDSPGIIQPRGHTPTLIVRSHLRTLLLRALRPTLRQGEGDESRLATQHLVLVREALGHARFGRGSTSRSIWKPAAANSATSSDSGSRQYRTSQPRFRVSSIKETSKELPPCVSQSPVG
jgi:hypothetical protein